MNEPQIVEGRMSAAEHRKHGRRMKWHMAKGGLLFLAPWLIGVISFVLYPLAYSLFLSFQKVGISPDGSGFKYDFVGMDNFKYAFFRDNVFPIELMLFVRESLLIVPITVIFALLVSILLNQKFPGRFLFRAIFFLPVIFATGQVLLALFDQGQGEISFAKQYDVEGLIYNSLPQMIAEPLVGILGKFVIILWFSGIQIVIFLAAFQTIPKSVYEAAQIDGATPWESFWKITFTPIVPFIFLNLVYTVVDLSFSPFNPILKHILLNMIKIDTGYGYASAIGWIYFAFIILLVGVLFGLARLFSSGKKG
ncbi:carbohydrate ABC transporter permease [Paenibacillus contaminans]|nr:sugar ABC transporter permease [Paenibacillus contaminans]